MKVFCALALIAATAADPNDVYYAEACAAGIKVDCVVSPGWSVGPSFGFGACSTTCGQGVSTRTRSVIHAGCNSGAACPR